MTTPAPFNPDDPFDAVADVFRRHMVNMFMATKATCPPFAELEDVRELECFLIGALTGMVGVAFAHVTPRGRDDVMQLLADYMPQARDKAEAILREGLH